MTIEFSFLSQYKSLVGFEVERSGTINRDELDNPVFQSQVHITLGLVFFYIELHFNIGRGVKIDDMMKHFAQQIKDKRIGNNNNE